MSCLHSAWLRLSQEDCSVNLQVTDRPRRLLNDMRDPNNNAPALVVMVGNKCKKKTLKKLGVEGADLNSRRMPGETHLFTAHPSSWSERSIFIADSEVPNGSWNRLPQLRRPQPCHEISNYSIPWWTKDRARKVEDLTDHIYHRVLFPFAEVICLFANDLGGIKNATQRVASWLDKGRFTTSRARPSMILVVEAEGEIEAYREFREVLLEETKVDVADIFQEVRVVSISGHWPRTRRSIRHCCRWDRLRRELGICLKASHRARMNARTLFSARHLVEFLHHVAKCANILSMEPVDYITISRKDYSVPLDVEVHLLNFVQHVDSLASLKLHAFPIIASSLILNNYPPGQHGTQIFRFHSKNLIET